MVVTCTSCIVWFVANYNHLCNREHWLKMSIRTHEVHTMLPFSPGGPMSPLSPVIPTGPGGPGSPLNPIGPIVELLLWNWQLHSYR